MVVHEVVGVRLKALEVVGSEGEGGGVAVAREQGSEGTELGGFGVRELNLRIQNAAEERGGEGRMMLSRGE